MILSGAETTSYKGSSYLVLTLEQELKAQGYMAIILPLKEDLLKNETISLVY